jgi:hypothetical protein
MEKLTDIKKALDNNKLLNMGVKDDIYNLISILVDKMPMVNLDNLYIKLKDLNIKDSNLTDDIMQYRVQDNTIYVDSNKLNNGIDVKHLLMHNLLNVATTVESNNMYCCGFSVSNDKNNSFLTGLNKGYTEVLTNYLVGDESIITSYVDEQVAFNLLTKIVPIDVFNQAYFSNNASHILTSLSEKNIPNNEIKDLINKIDNNLYNRKLSNKSDLGDIEIMISNIYFNTLPKDIYKEEIDKNIADFEKYLYLDSKSLKEFRPMYNSLDNFKKQYNLIKEDFINQNYINNKGL